MRAQLTYEKLMQLPVTFSEGVWSQIIPTAEYGDEVRKNIRIGSMLCRAYKALVHASDPARAEFWIMSTEPNDRNEFPDETLLVAKAEWTTDEGFTLIRIMLKDEEASYPPMAPPH